MLSARNVIKASYEGPDKTAAVKENAAQWSVPDNLGPFGGVCVASACVTFSLV